jgi:hypothetical protein
MRAGSRGRSATQDWRNGQGGTCPARLRSKTPRKSDGEYLRTRESTQAQRIEDYTSDKRGANYSYRQVCCRSYGDDEQHRKQEKCESYFQPSPHHDSPTAYHLYRQRCKPRATMFMDRVARSYCRVCASARCVASSRASGPTGLPEAFSIQRSGVTSPILAIRSNSEPILPVFRICSSI